MPSLTRLSPSSTVAIRSDPPRRRTTLVAATGSVGPRIAPSTKAAAHGMPVIACATRATTPIVTSTSGTASSAIGSHFMRVSSSANPNAAA